MDKIVVILTLFSVGLHRGQSENVKNSHRGPTFRTEPPSRILFSNTAGTELRCGADGYPTPKIHWQTREGPTALDVPGLRYQRSSGDGSTLVFPPFSRPDYKQEVHDAVYQCVASNIMGTVLSKEVHVRGVMKQRFTPQVHDEYVTSGTTGVLRCHCPAFVKEHVTVDAWIRNDGQVLRAVDEYNRGKPYTVLHSGELLLHDVKEKDSVWSYRCQTTHRLTGEMVSSELSGKFVVTEAHVSTLPRITFSRSQVRADEGTVAQLACVAQGNPPPSYRWMKDVSGLLRPVEGNSHLWISHGVLTIRRVSKSDAGQYQCIARNSIGERRVETSLFVTAPLEVTVRPQKLELNVGQEATLSCNVSGYPIHQMSWLRDRRPILASEPRIRLLSRDVLHISSVRRDDKGMYQCFAVNDQDSAQGTAEITLADAPPSLISMFPEVTVHPGERVSMKCLAMGNPVPRIVWHLDNGIVYKNSRTSIIDQVIEANGHVVGYLNISETRLEDSGEYQCQAVNDVGSVQHVSRLNVRGPPFVRNLRNATAISGEQLMLRCPYGGYPIARIRWFRGDMLLPIDPRQRVSHTGALMVQNIQRAADEGQYTCEVKNSEGHVASGSTYVSVVVAPEINSMFFPETVTMDEGSRAKFVCVIVHGDSPLRFQWLKNGQPFLAHGEATVHTYEDSSIITIKKVSSSDRGLYTCTATNSAASTNRTLQLVVNVPPQWTVEPRNASTVLGKAVWLDCAAVGYPAPTILWKKLIYTESAVGDFTWVHSSPRAHRYNNGTLTLSDVEENDAGSYLCQAQNTIGAGLSKIISLRVLVPPRFTDSYQSLMVVEGTNATLRCTAIGDKPISITWQKNMTAFDMKQKARYSIVSVSDKSETRSELQISSTSRVEDTGMFSCTAMSDFGKDEAQIQLIVQGRPDAPSNLQIANMSSRSIALQWDLTHDGNSHVSGSKVQYKTEPEGSWSSSQTLELIVSGSDTGATLRGLKPVTTYFVRVIAENGLGRSPPSDMFNCTTLEEAPSKSPKDVHVHSTGAQSIKVTWKPPPPDSHNGHIKGYYVGYRLSQSAEPYHFQKAEVDSLDVEKQHSAYITGLKPFSQYDIVVKAYTSAGDGPKSSRVLGETLETAPPTSPVLNVKSASSSSVEIQWEKDARDKSAITEYTLHYKAETTLQNGDGEWKQQKLHASEDSYTLRGLRCGTRYSLYVTASNSLGTGEPSVTVTAATNGAAPRSPKIENFLVVNGTSVTLRLNRWQVVNCPILRYMIKHKKTKMVPWIEDPLKYPKDTYTISHLDPGTEYVTSVTAYSDAGATVGEFYFQTKPENSGSPLLTAFGKDETDVPMHRKVTLVIPLVVSSLVLIILAFGLAICFRKHSRDRQENRDCGNQKYGSDSLVLNDIGKHVAVSKNKNELKTSHYDIPGKNADYAEPYSYNSPQREGADGLFATIKRYPTRSIYSSASHKQGQEMHTQEAGSGPDTWNSCRKGLG